MDSFIGHTRLLRGTTPLLVGAVILASCGAAPDGGGPDDAAATESETADARATGEDTSNDGTDGATESAADLQPEADGGIDAALPIAFPYGVLDLEIDDVRVTSEDPFDTASSDPEATWVGVSMTIDNPYNEGSFSLPAGLFVLVADGLEEDGRHEGSIELERTDRVATTVWFEMPADVELGDATLEFSDGRSEPAVVQLNGGTRPSRVDLPYGGEARSFEAHHGVSLDVRTLSAHADLDVALDEDGAWEAGYDCGITGVGRAPRDLVLVHVETEIVGEPTPTNLPSLSLNATNYGVPMQANADGVAVAVCESLGPLDTRREGEIAALVPPEARELTITMGCPCGGLLTGNEIETVGFSTTIDLTGIETLYG